MELRWKTERGADGRYRVIGEAYPGGSMPDGATNLRLVIEPMGGQPHSTCRLLLDALRTAEIFANVTIT